MATFNASGTSVNLSLQDGTFTYWGAGITTPNATETPVTTSTTFIESDVAGLGVQAIWGGTGFTYAAPSFVTGGTVLRSEVLTGTATSLTTLDAQNHTVFTLTGFSLVLAGTPRPTISDIFSGNDSVIAGAGNDTLDAGTGNDTVAGGLGDDSISGGVGADSIVGGAGRDWVSYANGPGALSLSMNTKGAGNAVLGAETDKLDSVENIVGTGFNDTIGGGSDTLGGASSDNLFYGKLGNDSLGGGTGNDTLVGGAGQDSLAGGTGNDYISFEDDFSQVIIDLNLATHTVGGLAESHSGFENVIGSTASDSITGSAVANDLQGGYGNDTVLGGDGNDTLVGGTGADSMAGGTGDDRLDGNADSTYQILADTLAGGAGNDYYVIESIYYSGYVYDQVVENAAEGTDTVEVAATYYYSSLGYALAANVENLIVSIGTSGGTAYASGNSLSNVITGKTPPLSTYTYSYYSGNFKLYGAAGNDTITGSHGADTLHGGTGADIMAGGRGNDVYYVDSTSDKVQERANFGTDKIVTTVPATTLQADIEDATLLGVATALDLTGNAGNNTLRGNQFANHLTGLDGSDALFGGAGNDTLLGGLGSDGLNGGMGNDSMDGGDGTDTVDFSNLGVAVILNLGSAAAQNTGAGTDTIVNIENATGGTQNDKLTGTAVANSLIGNNGDDTLAGLTGTDYLSGGNGNDLLQGGTDNDNLSGDAGDDSLFGGAGADVLSGGYAGADVFNFDLKEAVGYDTLADFVSGEDKIAIDISAFGVGDGDTTVDGAVTRFGSGGFAPGAELVIFTQGYAESIFPASTTAAAAAIGNASSAYAAGAKSLFVLDNGSYSHLYLFTSAAADATVTAAELQLIGNLYNAPETALSDYIFVA